jgi:hypothetical protein
MARSPRQGVLPTRSARRGQRWRTQTAALRSVRVPSGTYCLLSVGVGRHSGMSRIPDRLGGRDDLIRTAAPPAHVPHVWSCTVSVRYLVVCARMYYTYTLSRIGDLRRLPVPTLLRINVLFRVIQMPKEAHKTPDTSYTRLSSESCLSLGRDQLRARCYIHH